MVFGNVDRSPALIRPWFIPLEHLFIKCVFEANRKACSSAVHHNLLRLVQVVQCKLLIRSLLLGVAEYLGGLSICQSDLYRDEMLLLIPPELD